MKIMVIQQKLIKIKHYLWDIIIDLQNSDKCKIQLTIAINFIFPKDAEKERVMQSKRGSINFSSYNDEYKIVGEFFDSLRLKISM